MTFSKQILLSFSHCGGFSDWIYLVTAASVATFVSVTRVDILCGCRKSCTTKRKCDGVEWERGCTGGGRKRCWPARQRRLREDAQWRFPVLFKHGDMAAYMGTASYINSRLSPILPVWWPATDCALISFIPATYIQPTRTAKTAPYLCD